MKVLFAGGGTAGHINPAIAVANYICGCEAVSKIKFVGTKEGLETGLVPKSGYPLELIKVHGFDRSLSPKNIKNLLELPGAVHAAKKIIKEFQPDIVVGTGGYVSGPVLYAAAKCKIPTLIHESNAFPGVTTKILAKYVDTVAVGLADAKQYITQAKKIVVTGNPVRPSILSTRRENARRLLKLDERPFILIFGGSLGARDFNKTVVDWISAIAEKNRYNILMGTGKFHQYDDVMARLKKNGVDLQKSAGITVSEYIYDMDVALAAADLVISRAGASTLSELTAIGRPAILVPSPYVTGNHQEHNARAIESGGGAKVILEKDFTPEALLAAVDQIFSDHIKLAKMQEASHKMGIPDATERIYQEIKAIL